MKLENTQSEIIQREMTITHEDFFRLLPKALADYQFKISGQSVRVKMQSGSVNIQLMPESTRKIGNLELPVTHISFHFENIAQDQMQKFFDTFDRSYQKGGG